VPMAILAAGATFVFAWIPILGSTPVWGIGTIYLYTQDSPGKAVAMLLLGFLTSVSDNLVRPWVLKGRGEMHPLVSLVAIFGGIEMFGIFGVFIGPVIAAALLALLDVWPSVGRRFGLLASAPAEPPKTGT
jgi:predicted PurR-regulated permease PerM